MKLMILQKYKPKSRLILIEFEKSANEMSVSGSVELLTANSCDIAFGAS